MSELSIETVFAARDNDLDAVTAVVQATEQWVASVGRRASEGNITGGAALADDLIQAGRIAVWENLPKFRGSTLGEFYSFMGLKIREAVAETRRIERRPGVSTTITRIYESALSMAGGDPYEAQRLAQSDVFGHRKLSADTAYAARMAWMGVCGSLDEQIGVSGDMTIGDLVHSTTGIPEDLLNDEDREADRRAVIREAVHRTLGKLGSSQCAVLKGTYGISGPVPYFGTDSEAEFAAFLGVKSTSDVRSCRAKAKKRFGVLYLQGESGIAA